MSRKAKQPIALPKGVEVKVVGDSIQVKGPKGALHQQLFEGVQIKVEDGKVHVSSDSQEREWVGTTWSLLQNMVTGSASGFEKKLELIGVGYRAAVSGKFVELTIGYSHPTKVEIPEGVHVKVEKSIVSITGIDKQAVGQLAATIRAVRPPEPYQGKGIRYVDEYVRKKAGKAAAAAKTK